MSARERHAAALLVVQRADDVADARLMLEVLGLIDGPDARRLATDPPSPPAMAATDRVGHDEVLAGRPVRPSTAPPGLYLVPDATPATTKAAAVPRTPRAAAARPATAKVGRPRARQAAPATELTGSGRRARAVCGTRGGYERHLRNSEVTCPACRAAQAEHVRTRYAARKAAGAVPARPGRPPAACGTVSGYSRHMRNDKAPCAPCRKAMSVYHRTRRLQKAAQS